jgi:KUP system potassium uptake protein
VTAFTILTTWQRGRALVTAQRERDEGSLREFIDQLHDRKPPVQRVPGTAVFLNRTKETAPWRCAQAWSTSTPCTSTS